MRSRCTVYMWKAIRKRVAGNVDSLLFFGEPGTCFRILCSGRHSLRKPLSFVRYSFFVHFFASVKSSIPPVANCVLTASNGRYPRMVAGRILCPCVRDFTHRWDSMMF